MGITGANFPAMTRGIVAMFWYGAQTYAASTAVALLISAITGNTGTGNFLGMTNIMWISFIFVSGLSYILGLIPSRRTIYKGRFSLDSIMFVVFLLLTS